MPTHATRLIKFLTGYQEERHYREDGTLESRRIYVTNRAFWIRYLVVVAALMAFQFLR